MIRFCSREIDFDHLRDKQGISGDAVAHHCNIGADLVDGRAVRDLQPAQGRFPAVDLAFRERPRVGPMEAADSERLSRFSESLRVA